MLKSRTGVLTCQVAQSLSFRNQISSNLRISQILDYVPSAWLKQELQLHPCFIQQEKVGSVWSGDTSCIKGRTLYFCLLTFS